MTVRVSPVDASTVTFEELFTERCSQMVKLATLTTGSVALAEEVVQDALIQLHRNWASIDQPVAWLRVAVINRCHSWTRRQVLERRHAAQARELVAADDGITMRDALDAVTPRQRAALVLRFYEDLPEAEIASLLGCRPGTVKSLLARGLRTLRKELQS